MNRTHRKIGFTIGILLLIALGAFGLWRILLHSEVQKRFAALHAAGLPASGRELNAWLPTVPALENGALVLTQAFSLIRTFPDRRSNAVLEPKLLSSAYEWSSLDLSIVSVYCSTNTPALEKAHQALEFQHFRYPIDYSYGPDAVVSDLRHIRQLARIAALSAALVVEEGRTNQWPEFVQSQVGLAATLEGQPEIISLLVRYASLRQAVRATERCLNRTTCDLQSAKRLQAVFLRAANTNPVPFALIAERAMMAPVFRMSWSEIKALTNQTGRLDSQIPRPFEGRPSSFLWLSGFFERDLNFYMQTMDSAISVAGLPSPGRLALTNHFQTAAAVAAKRKHLLTSMLLPGLTEVVVRDVTAHADLVAAATSLAIERFRLTHARVPKKLEELVPRFLDSVPMDPFDGAEIKYRQLPLGYVVYSVGLDGTDEGGRDRPDAGSQTGQTPHDIVFVVQR